MEDNYASYMAVFGVPFFFFYCKIIVVFKSSFSPSFYLFSFLSFIPSTKTPPSWVMKCNSFGSFTCTMLQHTVCLFCAQSYVEIFLLFIDPLKLILWRQHCQSRATTYSILLCALHSTRWAVKVVCHATPIVTSVLKVTSEDPRCSHLLLSV